MIGNPLAMIRNTAEGYVAPTVTLDQEGCQRVIAHIAAQEAVIGLLQKTAVASLSWLSDLLPELADTTDDDRERLDNLYAALSDPRLAARGEETSGDTRDNAQVD